MAKASLARMSVDALLDLRDQIGKVLGRRADELKDQPSRLGGGIAATKKGRTSSLRGRKVPIKYRDRSGKCLGGTRSDASAASREIEGRREARRLCDR